jgi:tetratricopeptide (TPR) repeat protein
MFTFATNRQSRLVLVCLAALIMGCSGGETRKAKHVEKGRSFLAAGNFEKARIEFRNALQIAPTDSTVRFENGVVDEKLGNVREAAQFYEGAIDINKDNVPARAALGRLYVIAGSAARALETIKPSMDKHPDDSGLLTVRAAARDVLKDIPGALADAERAVQLTPNNEDAVGILAGIYQANGQSDKALALLASTIKQLPGTISLRLELAQLYSRRNENPQAESLLVELIRLKPQDKAHRLRLAQFYARLNRTDDAERVLRDGVKTLPGERTLKTSLIEFLAARRSRDIAEKELQGFIAQAPEDYALRFALARFYEQGKAYPKAEAVYNEVIAAAGLDGPGITARDRLAELRSQQNDAAGAEKLLGEVLAKVPRDDDALFLRANLALNQRDPKTAIADLRSVLRDQPNAVGVMRVLARAHLANGEPALAEETMRRAVDANPTDAATRLDLAKLLINLHKPEQARPVVDELIKQQPTNIDALAAQFDIAAMGKDLAGAKVAADEIVAANPKLALGYFYQGTVAEMDKRPDDAVRLYSASLQQQPTASETLQAVTRVLAGQNRLPEALKRLDDVAARYPENAVPLNIKGEALMAAKRTPEGIEAFKEAVTRDPKSWAGYRNLAFAQVANHDTSGAIATLQNAIAKVTSPEQLETTLGVLYQQNGKPDDAIRMYDSALRQDPQSDVLANNLAMLLVDAKRDPASIERAKRLAARFSNSDNPQLLDTYGWVLYKGGEATNAVTALQAASSKAPDLPVLWYHLGMAELLSGQTQAARESLTRSLKSGQNFSGMEEAKATLDKLARQSSGDTATKS